MLLDKISSKNQIVSDRFFRALYSKLLLPAAMNSSKASWFPILFEYAKVYQGYEKFLSKQTQEWFENPCEGQRWRSELPY